MPGSSTQDAMNMNLGTSFQMVPSCLIRHWKWTIVTVLVVLALLWPYLHVLPGILGNFVFWLCFPSAISYASPATVPDPFPQSYQPVPKIIHQTWKTREVPDKWKAAQQSCIKMHPGWEYRLWTDEDALNLIKEKYPWFLNTYQSYTHNIQRADAMRYFVLHEYGGIYLDLDIVCLKSLDFVRFFNFTAPKTYPIGVSNDMLASRPRDPFAHILISNLQAWNLWFFVKYATVMFSTGPMFVTSMYSLYNRKDEVAVLPAELYGKYASSNDTLFEHLHGSSWHGGDAKMVFWLEHNGVFMMCFAILAVATIGTLWWLFRYVMPGNFKGPKGSGAIKGAPGGPTKASKASV